MSWALHCAVRLLLALLACQFLVGCHTTGRDAGASEARDVQILNAEGEAELRAILAAGHLFDLHAPHFTVCQSALSEFYERTGYRPAWVASGDATPQALAILRMFQQADEKGLVPEDYDASRWTERMEKMRAAPSGPEGARFDLAVTVSLMRYVRDLHFGRANPRAKELQIDIDGRKYDLAAFLQERVVGAASPRVALSAVEPHFAGYWKALDALRAYRQMAARDDGERLPAPAKPIAPGNSYPGVSRLARRLRLLGDLPAEARIAPGSEAYEGALVEAVKSFQIRHGQTADGVLDAELVSALNVPLARRVRQLELTLERWRWLPHSSSRAHIVVNLPEFRLYAMDGANQVALQRRVIVGGARGRRSPLFEKEIKHLVFRPYWDVPPSIQRHEIVPHVEDDRDYIAKKRFEVVTREGDVVTDGAIDDDVLERLQAGRLRVRQKPGPANSLGLVKFVFPNEQNVYMHDTDAPELFARERRDLSHGCIRVEGAADLAAWVLRNNPGWDRERVEAAMNGDRNNLTVRLAQPVPVVILYATVALDEKGRVFFFHDYYGYDAALERALALD